jgi:GT2 family glycosyltransferase
MLPLVSVIVPSFNHQDYVSACLDSILGQTYGNIEVIVVDDGSTDDTRRTLHNYRRYVTVIEQENRGTQAARNVAISLSSGEFIAFIDSDDIWMPNKLELQLAVFDAKPCIGLVYSYAYRIDSAGNLIHSRGKPQIIGKALNENHDMVLQELLVEDFIPALTTVIPKWCIEEVGRFDESLLGAGDWDLWLRIAAKYPIACVEQPLGFHRDHAANTTKMLFRSKSIRHEHEQVLHKAFQLPEVSALPQQVRDKAFARVYLTSAEAEAIGGDAAAVGNELRRAIELDPTIIEDQENLAAQLIHLAHLYAVDCQTRNPYRQFTSEVFSSLSAVIPTAGRLKRRVLAESVMASVFSARDSRDRQQVRDLLAVGLRADPRWLRNLGVWSIVTEAYFGSKVASRLRKALRRIYSG